MKTPTIRLYNSLSNKLEPFKPQIDSDVRMYSCGPTVYNDLHIGNLSSFIYADLLRRMLINSGYPVTHVMNITDIDDKTIRDSQVEFPSSNPMESLKKLTDKYTKVFETDSRAVGIDIDKMRQVSAVGSIELMKKLVQKIIDNGFGYVTEDGVYFSIKAYTEQGKPYGLLQNIEMAQSTDRIADDEYSKDGACDFALWKAKCANEPSWDATFTADGQEVSIPGRPGWHIECSAMAEASLSLPFDIHTGGIDLKFPHHENEIAQSRASGAEDLAKTFIHNAHLMIDGRKMSKSLGNFYTLRDIEDKDFSAEAFRLLVLSSHYRTEGNFSWDILEDTQKRLDGWRSALTSVVYGANKRDVRVEQGVSSKIQKAIFQHLRNDLDTPMTISIVGEAVKEIERAKSALINTDKAVQHLRRFLDIHLGIASNWQTVDLSNEIKFDSNMISIGDMLAKRIEARIDGDYQTSDSIRDAISDAGYKISDLGTKGFKISWETY